MNTTNAELAYQMRKVSGGDARTKKMGFACSGVWWPSARVYFYWNGKTLNAFSSFRIYIPPLLCTWRCAHIRNHTGRSSPACVLSYSYVCAMRAMVYQRLMHTVKVCSWLCRQCASLEAKWLRVSERFKMRPWRVSTRARANVLWRKVLYIVHSLVPPAKYTEMIVLNHKRRRRAPIHLAREHRAFWVCLWIWVFFVVGAAGMQASDCGNGWH